VKGKDAENDFRLCRMCGKREDESGDISLTQFVFRYDACRCRFPKNLSDALGSSIRARPAEFIAAASSGVAPEQELTLDGDSFPLERYKPVYRLGSGASGMVYLASDQVLGKKVAIKILRTLSPEFVIAFQEEARTTSRLKHKYIVGLLDFGVTSSGAPYIVLEFVLGPSLEEVVRRFGPIKLRDFFDVFRLTCEALAYAHSSKVFHRDLKPGNILLTHEADGSFSVRIIDFGLAKILSDQVDASQKKNLTIVGTPLYMSPDQGLGRPFDARSEVYSLGCVMFEALCGAPPFEADTALELLSLHAEQEPPGIAQVLLDKGASPDSVAIPTSVEALIRKCLEKNPEDRFQTVSDVLEALNEAEFVANEEFQSEVVETVENSDSSRIWLNSGLLLIFCLGVFCCFFMVNQGVDIPKVSPTSKKVSGNALADIDGSSKVQAVAGLIDQNQEIIRLNGAFKASEIKGLEQYKYMTELDLSNNVHNDDVTSQIKSKYLKVLRLNSTPVKTLEYVSKLPNLQYINLSNTLIDGDAIKRLKHLPNLIELDIRSTPLKDEDLKYLADIPSLLKLSLSHEKYCAAALTELRERLPACSMKFGVRRIVPLNEIRDLIDAGEFDQAESQSKLAINVIEKTQGKEVSPIAAYCYWTAVALLRQGRRDECRRYVERSIDVAVKSKFNVYLPDAYMILMQTYDENDQHDRADRYAERVAVSQLERDGVTFNVAHFALRAGEGHLRKLEMAEAKKWLETAERYVKNLKSRHIKFASKDYTLLLAPLNLHLSEVYYFKNEIEKSKVYALAALKYLKKRTTDRPSENSDEYIVQEKLLSAVETRLAAIEEHDKNFAEAVEHQRTSIEYLKEVNAPLKKDLLYLRSLEAQVEAN